MNSSIQELHFPDIHIPITIDTISPVIPVAPTPTTTLYLSNLDDMVGTRVLTPTLYFYTHTTTTTTSSPFLVLRSALAAVLVPYYPFSGRLRKSPDGKLQVFFAPDQGALIVEAHTPLPLTSLLPLSAPNPSWSPLLYRFPGEAPYELFGMPLLIAQVTTFSCGGFSLGLRLCHCLCDGMGAMQLLSAWAAVARGIDLLHNCCTLVTPVWDREFFRPRDPPVVSFPHHEFSDIDEESNVSELLADPGTHQRCFRVSGELQERIRAEARRGDPECTNFDAMAAHVWRCWARALGVGPPECELRLTFSVNLRGKMAVREGFYGNAVGIACARSTAAELAAGELPVAAVRAARVGVTEEYARSTVDYLEVKRPRRLEFGGKLTVTQWTRFGMGEAADFGWGRPVYAGPIDLRPTPQLCVFLPDGEAAAGGSAAAGGGGGRSMKVWICLPEAAAERFREYLGMVDLGCEVTSDS